MNYYSLKKLWITELRKRIILASPYWTSKLLKETCDKIKAKYQLPDFKRKKVTDFLILQYIETPWITVKFPNNYYN